MTPSTESRIRDLTVASLAFAALSLWLWLWWRRAFASAAPDALLLWQQGMVCADRLRDCYNGLYPFGYPLLVGSLFRNDAVYAPTLLNMAFGAVSIAAFGMVARSVGAGLLATVLATAALAMHPTLAFAATNPGPEAAALLLLLLAAATALDAQIPRRSVRVALGVGLASMAAMFRSELLLLVPLTLLVLHQSSLLSRREALLAAVVVAFATLPQTAIQLLNGLPPWAGIHGFNLWVEQQALFQQHQLATDGPPLSLWSLVTADPVATLRFWAGNFAQLSPWIAASVLPAIALRGAASSLDRAIAVVAVVWGTWSAGDDIALGALVLAPVAVLQTARICVDLRSRVALPVRSAALALLTAMSVVHGLVLHAQTEEARQVKRRVEDVEALLMDSGATDAQRVFATNATLYLPSLAPHAMRTPGAWMQLPEAAPPSLQSRWCTETPECFVRSLIAANVDFVLVDESTREFMPALEPVQRDPRRNDSPHPCLEKSSAAGNYTVLFVACTVRPETGALRPR